MGNVARPGSKTLAVVALFFLALFPSAISQHSTATSIGANWENSCTGSICSLTVYADERYFPVPEGWIPINESFFPCPDGYCTNSYNQCLGRDNG